MKQITYNQRQTLVNKIYNLLMQSDEMDMGNMGNCNEACEILVDEWIKENNIELID